MIVVDTNVLVCLIVLGPRKLEAEKIFAKDSDWNAPELWRSEFRNVLASYMRPYGGMECYRARTNNSPQRRRGRRVFIRNSYARKT